MPILNVFELQIFLSWIDRLEFPKPKKKKPKKKKKLQYSKTKKATQLAIKQHASIKCFRVILGLRCQILAQTLALSKFLHSLRAALNILYLLRPREDMACSHCKWSKYVEIAWIS